MGVATTFFEDEGYCVKDTSADEPYDLVVTKADELLFVEVKGTSTAGEQVFLTKNWVVLTTISGR